MTDYTSMIQKLTGATTLAHQRDGWWMTAPDLDLLKMARKMKEWETRFTIMKEVMLSNNETAVIYHYCLDGNVYNIKVFTHENWLPSISVILPAAECIEQDIQDLFKVQFEGHPHPDRLILPRQLQPGLFREPGGSASKSER